MDSLFLISGIFFCFLLAYHFYGRFLQKKVFPSPSEKLTPAHVFQDGMDFVPTSRGILLGHHFISMAGITPILGPVMAMVWGFLPALIWVVLGTIFLGMTHDLGSLVLSVHQQGRSIGEASTSIIGTRAKILFLLFALFLLGLIMAVSILVIVFIFDHYPMVVLPVWFQVIGALILGYYMYRKQVNLLLATFIALVVLLVFLYLGLFIPITIPPLFGSTTMSWALLLLFSSYLAAVLPVWSFLQPRNYLNFWQLLLIMALALGAILMHRPPILAPAVNPSPQGAPLLIPFLFLCITGGALSGFHSLVASGMTGKGLSQESDARPVACSSVLLEGILAVLVILICSFGFSSFPDWTRLSDNGVLFPPLGASLDVFVTALATLMESLGLGLDMAVALGAMLVVSLAVTTLESGTRVKRYLVQELAEIYDFQLLSGKHPAAWLGIAWVFLLLLLEGGLLLWPLLAMANQLLAGMAFLIMSLYLAQKRRPLRYTLLPTIFIFLMTGWALLLGMGVFMAGGNVILTVLGGLFFILEIWFILEAVVIFRRLSCEEMLPLNL